MPEADRLRAREEVTGDGTMSRDSIAFLIDIVLDDEDAAYLH